MKIQLKRSNVLEGGNAKQPTAGQMEYGELAVNYNENDPAIFIKDSNNQIIRVAGAGYDYNDLDNIPTIGDGEITIEDADGAEVGSFTVNQTGDATITLPAATVPGDGEITIEQNSVVLGTFTVNQTGDTTITLPDTATISPPSVDEPANPSNGDIWIDSNECPPVLKIWSDCDGTGQWYELTSTGPKPINPQPGDGNESITPPVSGSGTQVDPYILTALTVSYGATGQTVETITLSNQDVGNLVEFIDNNSGTNGLRFEQPVGVVGANGSWSGKLYFEDTPTSSADGTFTGLLSIGSIYYQWAVTVEPALALAVGKGSITPTTGEVGDTFTGTATLTDAENPSITHIWELDGVSKQETTNTNSSNTYTANDGAGSLTYRQEVTDDNNTSKKVGANSDAVTVSPASGPSASMRGLRFDSARQNYFTRGNTGNVTSFTFSAWIKPTSTGNFRMLLGQAQNGPGTTYSLCQYRGDTNVVEFRNGTTARASTQTFPLNQWHHFVFTYDGSEGVIYGNGDEVVRGTIDLSGFNLAILQIGRYSNSYSDGYMSEVYFVDGSELNQYTFGKYFDDKWGPLDSTVILEKLKQDSTSPYATRPNMDSLWSSGSKTGENNVNPVTLMFNGDLSDFTAPNAGNNQRWEFTPSNTITVNNSLRIYIGGHGSNQAGGPVGVTIAGTDYTETPTDNTAYWKEFTGWTAGSTISKIFGQRSGAGSGGTIAAIEIDGRILVDGPADNSKTWSNSWKVGVSNGSFADPGNAFDGSNTTYAQSEFNNPQDVGFDFAEPFNTSVTGDDLNIVVSTTTSMTIWFGKNGEVTSANTDAGILGNTSTTPITVTIPSAGSDISSIEFGQKSGTGAIRIHSVSIGNKLLVDSGAQWNQSKVWSDYCTGTVDTSGGHPGTSFLSAFDGDTTTLASGECVPADGTTITWIPPEPLSGDVSIVFRSNPNVNDTGRLTVNGTDYSGSVKAIAVNTDVFQTVALPETGINNTQGVTWTRAANNDYVHIAAIIVDDKVLVDGGVGPMGFYLPFNPGATSSNYAGRGTGSTTGTATDLSTNPAALFDGNVNQESRAGIASGYNSGAGATATVTFNPPIAIPTGAKVEIWGATQGSSFIQVNGRSQDNDSPAYISHPINWTDTLADAGDNSITSITAGVPAGSGHVAAVWGIALDGALLINYGPLGEDASDNNNHFADNGFISSVNSSQKWSDNYTGGTTSSPTTNMFDGNIATSFGYPSSAGNGMSGTFTFTGFSSITSLRIYALTGSTADNGSFSVNGNDYRNLVSTTAKWIDIPETSLTTFAMGKGGSGGSNFDPSVRAIEVNGSILIDSNKFVSTDTVTDTPMRNYATLNEGKNGNLEGDGNGSSDVKNASSITFKTGQHYYWETIYTGGTGEHHIGVHDGSTTANLIYSSGSAAAGITQTSGNLREGWGLGDVIGVAIDVDADTIKYFKNGAQMATGTTGITLDGARALSSGANPEYLVNFGQQLFAGSNVTYDYSAGTVTIDADATVYNTLYETWSQWARTTLGYALDRIAKLEALLLADAETIAELRSQIESALSRIASIESDEINDDAVDNSLITLVGSLSSQITAWSERIETAETNLSALTSRVTTLES